MLVVYVTLSLWIGSGIVTVLAGRYLVTHQRGRHRDLHA